MRHLLTLIGIPAILTLFIFFLLLVAPEERSLGAGIRSVYVHVMFSVSGRIGLTLLGFIGAFVLLSGSLRWYRWAQTLGWVALILFSIGLLSSSFSSRVNWGAFFLEEPRFRMSAQIIALGFIVQILNSWLGNQRNLLRIKGALHAGLSLFMTWQILTTELVLHPRDPIGTSDATGIQITFILLLGLMLLMAGWVVWAFGPREQGESRFRRS